MEAKSAYGVKPQVHTTLRPRFGSEQAPWPKSYGTATFPLIVNSETSLQDFMLKVKE